MGHGQGDAALGGAVELRDDDAIQIERAVELARLRKAVLAGGGVGDQHGVHRQLRTLAHHVHHFLQLAHEVGRRVKAPRRVDEHEVGAAALGALDGVVAHAGRIAAALAGDHLDVRALRPHFQLLDGRRAERVGAAEDDRATCVGRLLRQLAHRGGLAGTVDAHEQHERGLTAQHVLAAFRERGGDLVVQQVEHGVGVGQRLARGLIAQTLHDLGGRSASDVGQDERLLEAVPELLVEIGAAVEQDVHLLLELVARAGKPLADPIEKSHVGLLSWSPEQCIPNEAARQRRGSSSCSLRILRNERV